MLNDSPDRVAARLRDVARNLAGIADTVSREAQEATKAARDASARAKETALLAVELDVIAGAVEANVREQVEMLASARRTADDNLAVMDRLDVAAGRIGAISSMIGEIAGRSRMLALNARIEAARAGEHGRGFDVVANEMSVLAQSTLSSTQDIDGRTGAIHGDVAATRTAFEHALDFVDGENRLLDSVVGEVRRQKDVAGELTSLIAEAATGIDGIAVTVGRLGSAATTVKLLSREILRAANMLAQDA